MLKRPAFILVYFFAWVIFFEMARVFFLLYEWPYTRSISPDLALQSLWYGLKMDVSAASYITVPVCLFTITGLLIPFFNRAKLYFIYTAIFLFIQLLLVTVDAEIYKAWGSRIDFTPLKYLSTPSEMWASVSHLPVFGILVCFLIAYLCLLWVFRKVIRRVVPLLGSKQLRLMQAVAVIFLTGLLFVAIRGGWQLSPLNQSSVYFSTNQFANNAAQNASWNFMHSITKMNQLNRNPYDFMSEEAATKYVTSLYNARGKTEQVLNVTDSAKPNIIFIIWESFTEKALNESREGKSVVPYFQQLIKEGIYFSNCYSSGDRTDKGISAVLSGYPALPKGSIVNYPDKTAMLPGLGRSFMENDYTTSFYYGGELEFANIKSYLTAQKFQQFITKENFESGDMNSKWGAHDDVVMKRILSEIERKKEPFFTAWLTLSSHEPFEIPVPAVFKGNDRQTKFLNSLHYTDSVVYAFIAKLKQLPCWRNMLVVIVADHGHSLPVSVNRADDFRIPLLWLGGALRRQNIVVEKTVSQLDIAGSVISQLNFPENPFRYSNNLFDSTSKNWSFFTFNDGIGFVTDSSRMLYDNAGRRVVFKEGKTLETHTEIAKSLLQFVYSDFLKK